MSTRPDIEAGTRMPGSLKLVLVVLCVQALGNGFTGLLLQTDINDRRAHHQDVAAFEPVLAYGSYLVAAALLACVVLAHRRLEWVWATVVVIECLAVLGAVVGTLATLGAGGAPMPAIVGIVLPLLVLRELISGRSRAYFDR